MVILKVLERNQYFMEKLGIYSYNLTEPTNEFFRSFAMYHIFLFTVVACYLISTTIFLYKNVVDFGDALDPCFLIIGGAQLGGMYVCTGLNMSKIKAVHLKLQQIVNQSISSWFEFFSVLTFYFFTTRQWRWSGDISKVWNNLFEVHEENCYFYCFKPRNAYYSVSLCDLLYLHWSVRFIYTVVIHFGSSIFNRHSVGMVLSVGTWI